MGYFQSTCLALPLGRFHLVSLYSDLNSVNGWDTRIQVKLSHRSLNEVRQFWAHPPPEGVGRSWYPPEVSAVIFATLITDASKFGWGGHLHLLAPKPELQSELAPLQSRAQGPSDAAQGPHAIPQMARGIFDIPTSEMGSSVRELLAVIFTI